jgi:serine/threonine-protein kinase
MAVVYLAEDRRLERRVAIKVLRPELTSVMAAERFLREIKLTANLHHPHILALHESGEADGLLYYVMPYVAGESLRGRLEREGRLPVDEAVRIAREVADALSYAHERDLLHRDIKPENILLEAGHALVADFGIAKALSEAAGDRLTDTGVSIGTPEYMSPEQAAGERELNEASDLYSLGCVLYEMLAGEAPVTDPSVQKVVSRKLLGDVRRVGELRPEVSGEIEAAVTRALATEPGERPSTAGEFTDALTSGIGVEHARRSKRLPRWAAAAAALVAVAAVAGLAWIISSDRVRPEAGPMGSEGEAQVAAITPLRIAVFPFEVQGDAELAYLGEAVMDLLSEAVDGLGELRRVDPFALMGLLRRQEAGPLDPEAAREFARHFGAGRYVLGNIVDLGDGIRLSASLYDLRRETEPVARASASGEPEELSALVAVLTSELLGQVQLGEGSRLDRVGTVEVANWQALKSYLQGEALMRRGWFDSAGAKLWVAVRADSTFALAWYRLHVAQGWGVEGNRGESIDAAMRYRDRLSRRDRLLAESFQAFLHGEGERAERLARDVVGSYPDHVEGWHRLGLTRGWYRWQLGLPLSSQLEAYDRAFSLDSGYPQLVVHATVPAFVQGRYDDVEALLTRWPAGGGAAPELRAARVALAVAAGDREAQDSVKRELETASDYTVFKAGFWVATYTDRLREARHIWEILASGRNRSESNRAWAQIDLAELEVARGRWSAARSEFERAAEMMPAVAFASSVLLSALPFMARSRAELIAVRDSVNAWEPPPSAAIPVELVPWIRQYALGLLSTRLGDMESAERWARELEGATAPPDPIGLRSDLAREIRALVALEDARPAQALDLLEGTRMDIRSRDEVFSLLYRRPVGRLLRAEALEKLDRGEEALLWYSTFVTPWANEYVFLAPVCLRIGEIYDHQGQRERAIHYYRRFVARWQDADPQYQPLVDDVRARIARLTADGTVE